MKGIPTFTEGLYRTTERMTCVRRLDRQLRVIDSGAEFEPGAEIGLYFQYFDKDVHKLQGSGSQPGALSAWFYRIFRMDNLTRYELAEERFEAAKPVKIAS